MILKEVCSLSKKKELLQITSILRVLLELVSSR